MAALLKDALKPNLVQTLEHVPAIVHGGPFANIAHGCNSVTATKMALRLADYAITEAGFPVQTLVQRNSWISNAVWQVETQRSCYRSNRTCSEIQRRCSEG